MEKLVEQRESPNVGGYVLLGSFILFSYLGLLSSPFGKYIGNPYVLSVFIVSFGYLVGYIAFRFASSEVKATFGVTSLISLSMKHILGIYLLAISLAWSFTALITTTIEAFIQNDFLLSRLLVLGLILLLIIYPLFDFFVLSMPGESGVGWIQKALEKSAEKIRKIFYSPLIASLLLYLLVYIFPITVLFVALGENLLRAITVWVVVFPLLSIAVITGAGIAEDMLSLKLVKVDSLSSWKKLGFMSIKFRKKEGGHYIIPRISLGKNVLILFAILTIIGTLISIGIRVSRITGLLGLTATIGIYYALFTLLNKGRGAIRQFSGLWKETGFKVAIYTIIFPVFLTSGVILSYVFELITSNQAMFKLASFLNINEQIFVLQTVLLLQNIAFLMVIGWNLAHTSAISEKRLAWDAKEIYTSAEEFNLLWRRIHTDEGKVALILVIGEWIKEFPGEADKILDVLIKISKEIKLDDGRLILAISQAIENVYYATEESMIANRIIDVYKGDIPKDTGARIIITRLLGNIGVKFEDTTADVIDLLYLLLNDNEISVRWEAINSITRITKTHEKYAIYAMGLVIKTVIEGDKEIRDSGLRALSKICELRIKYGQMAVSVFLSYLREKRVKELSGEAVANMFTSILKIRPEVTADLNLELKSLIYSEIKDEQLVALGIIISLLKSQYDPGINLILETINLIYSEHDEIAKVAAELFPLVLKTHYYEHEKIQEIIRNAIVDENLGNLRSKIIMGIKEATKRGQKINNSLVKIILQLAYEEDPEISKESILTLYYILEKDISILEHAYSIGKNKRNSKNSDVREAVVLLLEKVLEKDPASNSLIAPMIIEKTNDPEVDVRIVATSSLGEIVKSSPNMVSKILETLKEKSLDQDWRVRISVASTVKAVIDETTVKNEELIPLLIDLVQDTEEAVRYEASDTIMYLVDADARFLKKFYDWLYQAILGTKNMEIKASLVFLFSELTRRMPLQFSETILLISRFLSSENTRLRTAVVQSYEKLMARFEKKGSINPKLLIAVNEALDTALFVANSSDPSMRRSAYEAIVHLIKNLDPQSGPYRKGRKAIIDALEKHEKDPQLRNYLEKAKILTTPLTFFF